MAKYKNVTPLKMLHYEPCLAVLGAASTMRGFVHHIARPRSIKSADVIQFLIELRRQSGRRPITILLDNASVHKTIKVREFCAGNRITLAFNVPYKPWWNGIEEVWSQIKKHFRSEMLSQMIDSKEVSLLKTFKVCL